MSEEAYGAATKRSAAGPGRQSCAAHSLTLCLAALQPDRRRNEDCVRAAASCEWPGARAVRLEARMTDSINVSGEPYGDLHSEYSALGQRSLSLEEHKRLLQQQWTPLEGPRAVRHSHADV